MKKIICTRERTISYTLRKSTRAKHVRISVNCDGGVLVTQPLRVPLDRIETIVAQKVGWIIGRIDFFNQFITSRKRSAADYRKCKKEALGFVRSRIHHFNVFYGFNVGRISIRNQRTRWGSCSRRGNLNFNYRITHLASELVDYVVVHELCHLAELNHSKNFWRLVEQTIPRYNELRKALKQNSLYP